MPDSLDITAGGCEEVAIESVMRKMSEHRFIGRTYKSMSDDDYEYKKRGYEGDEASLMELGLKYITNKVMYGATTWYDWCVDNWGTKWNAYENEQQGDDIIRFQTAWNAPEKVIIKLSEMYPETEIEHWWADEDTACNTGYQVYKGGVIVRGGAYENNSNEAFETYILCRGESKCIYKDENGNWHHRKCCGDCDLCGTI